jgi:Uma2 family endonuclease
MNILDDLEFIEPDFMLFYKNSYMQNKRGTRIAGYPDLIVEVWSDSNTKADKEQKFAIYSNSDNITEHWYINQESNDVTCYIGQNQLESQSLERPLKTKSGLIFDLTDIAL